MSEVSKSKHKVLAIVGPTCTGKTALSLFLAKYIPCEIISCDSRNIYRHFDIGSAKPSKEEQATVPHHLIDVVDPNQNFTASQYADRGAILIEEISRRGKLPIVCGGTGFYARALLEGLRIPQIGPQEKLREEFQEQERSEPGVLFRKLQELDPDSALRLHPNDTFRIMRALEVSIVGGTPFSKQTDSGEAPYDVLWIGLNIKDRDKLRALLSKRIAEMMDAGMLAELEGLVEKFGYADKIVNTVNYRDLLKYLAGEYTLKEALERAEQHNWQLARRQIMWFKTNPKINWFYVDEEDRGRIENEVLYKCKQFLAQKQ